MKSRYCSGKHHHIFVLKLDKSGRYLIREYYCTCESSARIVGCCDYVMTIIWYLGQCKCILNPGIYNVSITIHKEFEIINLVFINRIIFILPSLAGQSFHLAFTDWTTFPSCLLAGQFFYLAFTGRTIFPSCLHWSDNLFILPSLFG